MTTIGQAVITDTEINHPNDAGNIKIANFYAPYMMVTPPPTPSNSSSGPSLISRRRRRRIFEEEMKRRVMG